MSKKLESKSPLDATPGSGFSWPRSDPSELEKFDPRTKQCTMNCGQSGLDPRSKKEVLFQCDECTASPQVSESDRFSVHIKGFQDMPKETQDALAQMVQHFIQQLQSENTHHENTDTIPELAADGRMGRDEPQATGAGEASDCLLVKPLDSQNS
jgi:hypothetical protein